MITRFPLRRNQVAQKRPLIMMGALILSSALHATTHAQSTAPTTVQTQTNPTSNGNAHEAATADLKAKRYKDAQAKFEALIAANYADPDAHFGLGLTLYALGDLPGARFEFQQLVRLAPERYEGHYNLGIIAARSQQYDEALAFYSKALELARGKASPANHKQLLDTVIHEYERRKDHAALAKALDEALKLTPNDHNLRLRLAQATRQSGQSLEALPIAYEVLRAQPTNVDAVLLIVDIYTEQNVPQRALGEIDKALAAHAASSASVKGKLLHRKAEVLAATGKTQDAIRVMQSAATTDPANAATHARLGEFLTLTGHRVEALKSWKTAVKTEPKNALYRVNYASAQLSVKDYEAARTNAALALRDAADTPTGVRAMLVRGIASYHLGKYAEARAALQSAALRAPDHETYLWLGLSEYALKDYAAAVTSLEQSVKSKPTLNARSNLGAALLAAGRYPEAEAALRGVIADAPKDGEAWYNLAWSVRSQGREDEARQAFKTSAQHGFAKAKGELR